MSPKNVIAAPKPISMDPFSDNITRRPQAPAPLLVIRLSPHQSGVCLYNHETVGMRHWGRGGVPFISVVIDCEREHFNV